MRLALPSALVLGFGLVFSALILASDALAQAGPSEITFPVAELGNCESKEACKIYCDKPANISACISFAEKNGLMPKEEIEIAKKFIAAGAKGPGGCAGKDACEAYCDNIDNINECVAFAEKTGILPPAELQEAKKVQAAIARGVKPPACRSKDACEAYCENPENMKECIAFGEAAGFLEGEELEEARKVLVAIEGGLTPPPCRGREACEAYCTTPDHMEACMEFALAAGLMTGEEEQESRKVLEVVKKGIKPPACRGKEECDLYCAEPGHTDECVQFAVAAGFISEKEAEAVKKTGGKGPGGCVGKDACEAFCSDPANQMACLEFARASGLIPEEEVQKMEAGLKEVQGLMQGMPPEVEACLKNVLGGEGLEKVKRGEPPTSREMEEKIGSCFSQMKPGFEQAGLPDTRDIPDVQREISNIPGDLQKQTLPPLPALPKEVPEDARALYETEKARIYQMEQQRVYEAEKARLMQEGYDSIPSAPTAPPRQPIPSTEQFQSGTYPSYPTPVPPTEYQQIPNTGDFPAVPTLPSILKRIGF